MKTKNYLSKTLISCSCAILSWSTCLGLSTARAEGLPEAEWEVVGELAPHWTSVSIPLSGGRALLTGLPEPCSFDPNLACYSNIVYLYDPNDPVNVLRRVADAPGPLNAHFGAALGDGRVLVGGGHLLVEEEEVFKFLPVDGCFIYDPESDVWSEAARLPKGTFNFYTNIAATLKDGRVIITGGSTSDDLLPQDVDPNPIIEFFPALASRQVYIFDPDGEDGTPLIGKWDEKAKMPATRTFATHAAVIENSFGIPLDPKSNVQVGRVTHHTVVLHDGKVLLIGGRWSQPTLYFGIPQVDLYDPETDEWTRLADMPAVPDDADAGYGGRGFPGVSLLGSGEVLIFGGLANRLVGVGKGGEFRFHAEGPSVPRSSAIILNPMTNQWRRVGNMNVGRSGLLAAPWPSVDTATFAIAIGGLLPHTSKKIPPAEVYDSSTETWFLLPSEPEAETDDSQIRQGTGLDDGTVLTWSSDPSLGPYGNTSVKRLHPAGLDE